MAKFENSGIIVLGGNKDTKGLKGDEFKAKVAENVTAKITEAGGTIPWAPVMGDKIEEDGKEKKSDILPVEYTYYDKTAKENKILSGYALSKEFAELVGDFDGKNNSITFTPKEFVLNKDLAAKVYEATKGKEGKEFGEAMTQAIKDLGIGAEFGSIVDVASDKGGSFKKIAVGGSGFGKEQREGNGEYMAIASEGEKSFQKEMNEKAKEKKAQEKTPGE